MESSDVTLQFISALAGEFPTAASTVTEWSNDFAKDVLPPPAYIIMAEIAGFVSRDISSSGEAPSILRYLSEQYPQVEDEVKALIGVGFIESLARQWETNGPEVRRAAGASLVRLLDVLEAQGAVFGKDL